MTTAKLMGAIFSLVMCLGMLAICIWSLFFTKLPLIMPLATAAIAVISGVMVRRDWTTTWWPLLTGKKVS